MIEVSGLRKKFGKSMLFPTFRFRLKRGKLLVSLARMERVKRRRWISFVVV